MHKSITCFLLIAVTGVIFLTGCRSPQSWRESADDAAYGIIRDKQSEAIGRTEAFTVLSAKETMRRRLMEQFDLPVSGPQAIGVDVLERGKHWPKDNYVEARPDSDGLLTGDTAGEKIVLSMSEAIIVAARSSREYQGEKEGVFRAALDLDLARDGFRSTFAGLMSGEYVSDRQGDEDVEGIVGEVAASAGHVFKNGTELTARIGVDLVKLLSQEKGSSSGVTGDASITIPLLRGAGRHIAAEPLTQAERNAVYAIWGFEEFKRNFAVGIARGYLDVLNSLDGVNNARETYESLIASTRRAARMADAGRLPEIQLGQVRQEELVARNRWIRSVQSYHDRLDGFRLQLGVPVDAPVELDPEELTRLAEQSGRNLKDLESADGEESVPLDAPIEIKPPDNSDAGPYEMPNEQAIRIALANRLDLRAELGSVDDARRQVTVAADLLRGELTLLGSVTAGEGRRLSDADEDNGSLDFGDGISSALLTIDLPLERTQERNQYRASLLNLEQSIRQAQESEDLIKLAVRRSLRNLLEARESMKIQQQSVRLARRQEASTSQFLDAGRAEVRDLLEAQQALLDAQNALTEAIVNYRVAELELQQQLGVLEVNEKGIWREYTPPAKPEAP